MLSDFTDDWELKMTNKVVDAIKNCTYREMTKMVESSQFRSRIINCRGTNSAKLSEFSAELIFGVVFGLNKLHKSVRLHFTTKIFGKNTFSIAFSFDF